MARTSPQGCQKQGDSMQVPPSGETGLEAPPARNLRDNSLGPALLQRAQAQVQGPGAAPWHSQLKRLQDSRYTMRQPS